MQEGVLCSSESFNSAYSNYAITSCSIAHPDIVACSQKTSSKMKVANLSSMTGRMRMKKRTTHIYEGETEKAECNRRAI